MNKQDATRYIHQMLEQDHSQDEIVWMLADQLRAPKDLLKKFVAQTATEYHNEKARQAEESKPTWLRDLQSSANAPAQPTQLTALPQAPQPTAPTIQLPPWLRENEPMGTPHHAKAPPSTAWQRDQRDYVLQQLELGRTYGDVADSLASRTGVVPSQTRQFIRELDMSRRSQKAIAAPQPVGNSTDDVPMQAANLIPGWDQPKPPRDPLKDPQLIEFVLDNLGSRRKRSDVVMAVCERANLSWEQAERVVAQAAIQKHSQGAAQTSEAMMFIGILGAVGGFALAAVYGLPMLAQWGTPMGLRLRLPFNVDFATRQPALAVTFLLGGLILVGFGAAMAYIYYHAAEEQEA